MKELATIFRAAQFYAHAAHNLAHGKEFLQDHEFFGELYGAYEEAYDSVVERMIGLNEEIDIPKINMDAAKDNIGYSHKDSTACYNGLFDFENEICELCSRFNKGATLGTQNLLQGLADDSEKRQYKIQQRLK